MYHRYNRIVTHHRAGLDEMTALMLLLHGGKWGITQDTPTEFMKKGDYENPKMEEASGVLYLGCGQPSPANWANEHYINDCVEDISCAYLVARELKVDKWVLGPLIKEVTREDRHGSGTTKKHFAQYIKDRYELGDTFEQIYPWVEYALFALIDMNWSFERFSMSIEDCYTAIEATRGSRNAQEWIERADRVDKAMNAEYIRAMAHLHKHPEFFYEIETYQGKKKAFIPDSVQERCRITQAARSQGADIVLMQSRLDFGQVGTVIQTKHDSGLCLLPVLEALRMHEILTRKSVGDKSTIESFKGEGTHAACPYWHGQQAGKGKIKCTTIMSRAKSRPLAENTAMEFEYIVDLFKGTIIQPPSEEVVAGFDSQSLHPGGFEVGRVFATK